MATENVSQVTAGSTAVSIAKFAGAGFGLGVLAMIGADVYNGIKGLVKGRKTEKKSQQDIEEKIELRIRRELAHESKGNKKS